jgi:hypothetical protein
MGPLDTVRARPGCWLNGSAIEGEAEGVAEGGKGTLGSIGFGGF